MHKVKCDIKRAMNQISNRMLSKRSIVTKTRNFYEVLGVERASTHNDIKGAYYKLSMVYHPDKNKDSLEASEKFREITAAYEVLGNFRLRKLYDKGMIHTAGDKYQRHEATHENDENDATTRFYKARMNKERRTATGRTPIYDFDEWTSAHYGDEFKRQQKLRQHFNEKENRTEVRKISLQNEMTMMVMMLAFIIFFALQENFDVDRTKEKKKQPDKK